MIRATTPTHTFTFDSDPSAQTGDWTVETANGSLNVTGTISGSTTLELILGVPTAI